MGLTLTILGCSGTYAAPDNACSGYLLDDGSTRLWIDVGPGTLANVQRFLGPAEVDAVLVTHNHPDHWLDLPVLRNALRYYLNREHMAVYAPSEVLELAVPVIGEIEPTFSWQTVADGDELVIGDMVVRLARTDHPVETMAVGVTAGGRTFAYSSDTGPRFSLAPLGSEFDAVLVEATLTTEEPDHVHLTARQAGALATEAGARRLLLTHIPPGTDPDAQARDARETFAGPTEAVRVNERYPL